MSADALRKEQDAFSSFFATFQLARPVTTISDLSDGAALFEILSTMYRLSLYLILLSTDMVCVQSGQRCRLFPPAYTALCATLRQLGSPFQFDETSLPSHDTIFLRRSQQTYILT